MNQVARVVLLCALAAGCDPFRGVRAVEENSYTRKPDQLREVSKGSFPGPATFIFAADLDGNGRDDLVMYNERYSFLQVGMNALKDSDLHVPDRVHLDWSADPLFVPKYAIFGAADFDGDGAQELAVVDRRKGSISWYIMQRGFLHDPENCSTVQTTHWIPRIAGSQTLGCLATFDVGLALADVNGDGREDLLCGVDHDGPSWTLSAHPMLPDGSFGAAVKSKLPDLGPKHTPWHRGLLVLRAADLDGDKRQDLVLAGRQMLRIAFGDGGGRFADDVTVAEDPGLPLRSYPVLGDVDRDGATDVLWVHGMTSEVLSLGGRRWTPNGKRWTPDANLVLPMVHSFADYRSNLSSDVIAHQWTSGDVDDDGIDDLVGIGPDVDYGHEGPRFVRVLRGSHAGPELASSTRVCTEGCGFGDLVLSGTFLGNGRDQVLVVEGLHYRLFDWGRPQTTPGCGDGQIQPELGEQCDGYTMSVGCSAAPCAYSPPRCPGGGWLSCDAKCRFDHARCHRKIQVGLSLTAVSPSVGCQGGLCLVAWTDGADLLGVRVDANKGAALEAKPLQLGVAADSTMPVALAADGLGFWVLWHEKGGALRATRVLRNGSIKAEPTLAEKSTHARGTCNDKGICLVAWSGSQGVEAALVDTGSPVVLAPTLPGQPIVEVAVASDGAGFLVVWQREKDETGVIHGARVSETGALLDTPAINLAATGGDRKTPAVTFDGEHYLVVWVDDRADLGTYGVRVSPGGEVCDAAPLPVVIGDRPAAAAGGGRSLVTSINIWDGITGTAVSQKGRVLEFPPLGERYTRIAYDGYWPEGHPPMRPDVAHDSGSRFAVAWTEGTWDKQYRIHCTLVDLEAALR